MSKVLLLFCVLLLVAGATSSAEAARPTAYVRAKMKGRVYVHRPNYKLYKARKRQRHAWLGQLLPKRLVTPAARSRF
ncbi:hypothetical protein [Hymenobacter persicinus]|uniref:Uncharacterized protein n=1 Tax=Hymenobacter persicinus TaxID=2025506 RepID=A0A4Q5LH37_9BACT|nr:hypothetical protein [Hymenobacter persicinus]RYU83320.1 hypothetical protein EWM57_03270 [Hymenobacter persicinus]